MVRTMSRRVGANRWRVKSHCKIKAKMSKTQNNEIWPSEAGIIDLPDDYKSLAVPAIADIIPVWVEAKAKLSKTDRLESFNQRLAREWAIESNIIEDVFHISRGTTLVLIEQGLSAALIEHGETDKPPEYVVDILKDSVEALEWLFEWFVVKKNRLTSSKIKELQSLLTLHQSHVDVFSVDPFTKKRTPIKVPLLRGTWKEQPNNVEFTYCPPLRVEDEMSRLLQMHNRHLDESAPPEVEAAWLHHRFTQIHPFHDGNGRAARALASLVFIQAGLFPVVISRGEMRDRYICALEAADSGSLKPLVDIFAETQQARFDRALNIVDELSKPAASVELAVQALKSKFNAKRDEFTQMQRRVFELSDALETEAGKRFESVRQMLSPIDARVSRSTKDTSHYYRQQVVELAKQYDYFANTTDYRAWTRLLIESDPAAQLLLSFHVRGYDFTGVMMCSPLFELIFASGGDGVPNDRTQIGVTDRPFEFYFTEKVEELRPRFSVWLDETIALALAQFQRNL